MDSRFSWAGVALGVALFGCGGAESAPRPRTPNVATRAPREDASRAVKPWGRIYERACRGSITHPILDPAGRAVAYCGGVFDAAGGHFRGNADIGILALISEERALRDNYSNEVRLGPLLPSSKDALAKDGSAKDVATSPAGSSMAFALSPDGNRFVTLETSSRSEQAMLVVRELPDLRIVRRTPVSSNIAVSEPVVGFLADGRELVFAQPTCARNWCAPPTLYAVQDRHLLSLPTVFENARAIHLGTTGERAAVITSRGARLVVSLPYGKPLYDLGLSPVPKDEDESSDAIAMSADSQRVAVAGASGVEIFALKDNAFALESRLRDVHPSFLRFSPDGRTLFMDQGNVMIAFRKDAPDRVRPAPKYNPSIPRGVLAGRSTGNEFAIEEGTRAEPDLIGWYLTDNHDVEFEAFASDPSEFEDARDAEAWGRRIADRFYGDATSSKLRDQGLLEFRAWEDGERQRSVEMGVRFTGGCDPSDVYVRAAERGGVLYRVEIRVALETPVSELVPWKMAFFDAPLGASPLKRVQLANLQRPRHRSSPC